MPICRTLNLTRVCRYSTPSFQSFGPSVVNAKDRGAAGDGVTDDWHVLQSIFDAAASTASQDRLRVDGVVDLATPPSPLVVVLPKGTYAVSRPLYLPEAVPTALVGVAHIFSLIVALGNFSGSQMPGKPVPMVRTGSAQTWLCGVGFSVSTAVTSDV